MQIAGLQKLTLVDFPGHVAATVFTRGCNFRCGFCHNPELVIPERYNPLLDEKELFNFLESRYGKLTGICITGGEPTLQKDCDKFISHMKALGFDVKLDTNGSNPKMLEKIIKDGDVDYIAMDIKANLSKYPQIAISKSEFLISNQISNTKSQKSAIPLLPLSSRHHDLELGGMTRDPLTAYSGSTDLVSSIQKSINLIMNSGIPYEFRTTVCHPLHEVNDFYEIGELIKGADKYFIQQFVKSKHIDSHAQYKPFSDSEIEESKNIMTQFVKNVEIR